MNSPQAEITVRGRGQQKLGPTSFSSEEGIAPQA